MKRIFSNSIAKKTVDILLVAGLVLSIISAEFEGNASWWSFHCLVSMTWYALTLVHVWQHWRLIVAVFRWKVLKRNKITFITIITFIMITLSVILFMVSVSDKFVSFHHIAASLFSKMMIVHTIHKTKRFVQLFKKNH